MQEHLLPQQVIADCLFKVLSDLPMDSSARELLYISIHRETKNRRSRGEVPTHDLHHRVTSLNYTWPPSVSWSA